MVGVAFISAADSTFISLSATFGGGTIEAGLRATNLSAAAIQIAEAVRLIARYSMLQHEMDRENTLRAIDRLLYSALAVVNDLADQKLSDVVGSGFDNSHLDPWVPVEQRCDELKTGASTN